MGGNIINNCGVKCEVRVYDSNFNWIAAAANISSVQFRREMCQTGRFELNFPSTLPAVRELTERGNIITINGDGGKSGIIRGFSMKEGRKGAMFTVYGDTGQGLAKQRRVVPPTKTENPGALGYDRIAGNAESIIKHYISRHMTAPSDTKRKFNNMLLAENKNRGSDYVWQARYTLLSDELTAIAEYGGIGWEINADIAQKAWICDVYEGVDRTEGQDGVSPVVFKLAYQNVDSYSYSEDYQNFRNTGYAGGKGTDENRLIYTIGADITGYERWETFLDCANAADINELQYYGEQKMSEMPEVKTITLDTLPKVFTYGKDYFMGDKVTVVLPIINQKQTAIVTSVNEIWEPGIGYKCEVRLGKKLPNIVSNLKYREEIY